MLVFKRPLDLHRQVSLRFYVRIQWGPRDLAPWSYPTILAKGEYSATKGACSGVETRQLVGQTYAARAQKTPCPASQDPA